MRTAMTYERPSLVRHRMGLRNKYSRADAVAPLTHIDGVSIEALVERHGSPLFIFSERTLRANYRGLRAAFERRLPRTRIAWSYKTNYLDAICRTLHQEGAWAEVVSEFEFEKARNLGVPGERIHINGPLKTEPMLRRVLPDNPILHLDNFDEIALVERVAADLGLRPRIAVRLNMAVSNTPHWSRFGFDLESGEAQTAIARCMAGGRLDLVGLHCHLGTFVLDPSAYREQASKLADLTLHVRDKHGVYPEFLDIGGGFASPNKLKAQYLPADACTPSFDRYAEAVADGLSKLAREPEGIPTVVLETGRAMVDSAGFLVSTAIANKRTPDGRRAVVIDAGVNMLFTSFWYDHEVVPAQALSGPCEPTVLHGPLCMNIDVMRESLRFPALRPGQRVVFKNVGAYNVTQWMQFITYRPAVVMVGEDGRHALMRRREDLAAVRAQEEMPSWLRG